MTKLTKKQKNTVLKKFDKYLEDRQTLKVLKRLLVEKQDYDLSADIRELETTLWPECNTTNPEVEEAKTFLIILQMGDFKMKDVQTAHYILQLAKLFIGRGDSVDIQQITSIKKHNQSIFGEV